MRVKFHLHDQILPTTTLDPGRPGVSVSRVVGVDVLFVSDPYREPAGGFSGVS